MSVSSLGDIGQLVGGDLQQVHDVILQRVHRQPAEIRESLDYYFSSRGKFLRPLLAFLSARAATGGTLTPAAARETVLFAAAVEFVHNASLVHDDIMDGDLVRRDMKTLHAKYGASSAVLLGDVLHITVFDLLGRISNRTAISIMTRTIREMCYGQLLDVHRKEHSAAEYRRIIRGKTGTLMAAACVGGALMSGAGLPARALRSIAGFGLHAGMLYQMVDDFLDGDGGFPLSAGDIDSLAVKTRGYLKAFGASPYRSRLDEFVDYTVALMRHG